MRAPACLGRFERGVAERRRAMTGTLWGVAPALYLALLFAHKYFIGLGAPPR